MSLSKTKRQVVTLYGSSLLGILTGVFVSILNTSNLPPVEYGDVRYINNFISFFSGILLFGYFVSGSRLLALSKSKEETRRLKGILTTILLTTFATMMVIMVVCGVIHGSILHKEYSYLFYTAIPVCGSVLFLNYINTTSQGDNNINAIAAARLFPSLIYLVVAYLIYRYYGASRERMILLHNGIAMIFLLFLILQARPDFSHLRESWKILNEENKKYGLQVYYGSLANVSVQYVAGITLGLFGTNNALKTASLPKSSNTQCSSHCCHISSLCWPSTPSSGYSTNLSISAWPTLPPSSGLAVCSTALATCSTVF